MSRLNEIMISLLILLTIFHSTNAEWSKDEIERVLFKLIFRVIGIIVLMSLCHLIRFCCSYRNEIDQNLPITSPGNY